MELGYANLSLRVLQHAPDHTAALWEVFWMVFHDQPRKTTIRRIMALGFSARDAIEMVQDAEKEPN